MAMNEEERKAAKKVSQEKYMSNPDAKKKRAAYKIKYRRENKEKIAAYKSMHQKVNMDAYLAATARHRDKHPDRVKRQQRASVDRRRDEINIKRKIDKKELVDFYVRQRLTANSTLAAKHIPQWLIDLKREHIKITRILRERKQNEQHPRTN
jgi:hypothetical protein